MRHLIIVLSLILTGCAYQAYPAAEVKAPFKEQGSYIPAAEVRSAVRKAHSLFTYESDEHGEWTSYGLELATGIPFEGDCEDFALSVADYLMMQGYAPRHMAIATLDADNSGVIFNHAVLIIKTENGQLVVDNNSDKAVSIIYYDTSAWYSMRRLDSEQWHLIETK